MYQQLCPKPIFWAHLYLIKASSAALRMTGEGVPIGAAVCARHIICTSVYICVVYVCVRVCVCVSMCA